MLASFVLDATLLLLAPKLEADKVSPGIFFLFGFDDIKVLYLAPGIIDFLLEQDL